MSEIERVYRKFLDELPAKTGKSIDQWKTEIVGNGPSNFRERMAWLKQQHGIAYRPAFMLAQHASGTAVDYSDGAGVLEAMFSGPKAHLRPVCAQLSQSAHALGSDVREIVCKTMVSLKRKYVFMQIKPASRTRIDLGLALPAGTSNTRLVPTRGVEKGDRIGYRIPLASIHEIDAEVPAWMKTAYDFTPAGENP